MWRSLTRRLFVLLSASALAIALALSTAAHAPASAAARAVRQHASVVGPKAYYLGLGDSLAFGYQPDLNWDDGYVQQLYSNNLRNHGVSHLVDYGCNGETSNTMISGGCPYWYILHNYYLGAQLSAAVSFLHSHAGQVSPVTLDMGANDLLPDINSSTCAVSSSWSSDLANLSKNLTGTILPQLVSALTNSSGQRMGDLVMMNYYDPFINSCPNSLPYIQALNQTIANDAAKFGVPVANVYNAFGGNNQGANICNYTWICTWPFYDVHATDTGYSVIANAFAATLGY
jgi:lysophospholipase L1-like esterase